ncbi:hypothetical protein [Cognatishimia sp. MH4019]|uniref:hypothetical protein n=1 Tax=Cognatishimia sp. MH4019 TaxID=2854030 RepID=UPI001CD26A0D|nr:hypothetical protein [Cognatishimia sp. MH4019]
MRMLYSAQTKGFYSRAVHGDQIPDDAVDITDERYAQLLDGQKSGHTIDGDSKGQPVTIAPPPATRESLQKAAFARLDQEHANYLVALTGGATVAERDTWKVKEEAARAFEVGTATPGQAAMLAAEAEGAGITKAALAANIIAKADAFLELIGIAAGLRARGRSAIVVATDEAVPLDQVEDQIAATFTQLAQEVQAAITQIQNATALNEGGNNHA